MFTDKIDPIVSNIVSFIGGTDIITKGIGTFRWYCIDDGGANAHK